MPPIYETFPFMEEVFPGEEVPEEFWFEMSMTIQEFEDEPKLDEEVMNFLEEMAKQLEREFKEQQEDVEPRGHNKNHH